MIGNLLIVLNFNRLFLKLNRFICNQLPVLPDIAPYTCEQRQVQVTHVMPCSSLVSLHMRWLASRISLQLLLLHPFMLHKSDLNDNPAMKSSLYLTEKKFKKF